MRVFRRAASSAPVARPSIGSVASIGSCRPVHRANGLWSKCTVTTARHQGAGGGVQQPKKKKPAETEDPELVKAVQTWGKSVFAQFDTDKNGFLSNAELARALKALPPGPMQGSIDDLVAKMDANGDGSLSVMEWLNNLAKVPALAFSLDMVVDSSTGTVTNFRSFAEQKAKREREVAALKSKENRTEGNQAGLLQP